MFHIKTIYLTIFTRHPELCITCRRFKFWLDPLVARLTPVTILYRNLLTTVAEVNYNDYNFVKTRNKQHQVQKLFLKRTNTAYYGLNNNIKTIIQCNNTKITNLFLSPNC